MPGTNRLMGGFRTLTIALVMLNVAAAVVLIFGKKEIEKPGEHLTEIGNKEDFRTITIQVAGRPKIHITQEMAGSQMVFEMDEPLKFRCTPDSINGHARALYYLNSNTGLKPEATGPDAQYGLDKPALVFEWTEAKTKARHVIRVGNEVPITQERHFKIDNDATVYLMALEGFDSLTREPAMYEDLAVGDFEPLQVRRIEGDLRILRVGTPEGPRPGRDRMAVDWRNANYWWIAEPEIIKGDPIDPRQMDRLMGALRELRAVAFEADTGQPADFGFENPELILTLHLTGPTPVRTYTFGRVVRDVVRKVKTPDGKEEEKTEKETTIYVKTDFRGRIARIEEKTFLSLLSGEGFDSWRFKNLYDFTANQILYVHVAAEDLGEFELVRPAPQEQKVQGPWKILKPAVLEFEEAAVEMNFVGRIIEGGVIGAFMERDPADLLTYFPRGKPDVVLTLKVYRGLPDPETVILGFGRSRTGEWYAQKQGLKQIYRVSTEYAEGIQRMELNIARRVAFSCDAELIKGFRVEHRVRVGSQTLSDTYECVRDSAAPGHPMRAKPQPGKDEEPGRAEPMAARLNYLDVEYFETRDLSQLKAYGLTDDLWEVKVDFDVLRSKTSSEVETFTLLLSAKKSGSGKINGMIRQKGVIFELKPEVLQLFTDGVWKKPR